MLLCIDIGNTEVTLGIFDGERLLVHWHFKTDKQAESADIEKRMAELFARDGFAVKDVAGISLASVVPRLTEVWSDGLEALFGMRPVLCTAESAGDLFHTNYPAPAEIGADRVADAIAAKAFYGVPAVVVDFGTATNIEVLDKDGVFLGGIIMPGAETSMAALFAKASRLFEVELVAPDEVIGRSTEHAIQSGIVFGEADRADGLVKRVFDQLGYETTVIATGGLSHLVAQHSRMITDVDPELTLKGLRLLYQYVMGEETT